MSHVDTSQLSGYNSLSDKHLAGYFANDRMRGHLRKSGLITRRGQIVSETSYRLNIARKEHKKHVKDLLAQAIVHKTLDLERHRQVAIRQKLEEIAKIELVQRVRENRNRHVVNEALLPLITASPREKDSIPKRRTRSRSGGKRGRGDSSRSRSRGHETPSPRSGQYAENDLLIEERTQRVRRSDEDILPFLSPRSSRPQSGPSPRPRRHRSVKYRPISAPSNMPDTNSSMYESVEEDGDVTYVDDDGNTIDMSDCEQDVVRSGRNRTPRSREEGDTRHLYSLNPLALRRYANALAKVEQVNTLASPYLIPQIPIPPSSPRTGHARHRSAGNRGRSTSSDKSPKRSPGVDLHRREPPMRHQGDVHSNCVMTMKFHGWALKLARERTDNRHDVTVEQQHCGGNTLTVFKGLIEPGSTFSFTSKRHRGYPFSLTLYVDGRQDARVSTCCEFGHSKKVRLGAKQGHFSFVGIKGMNPCYKCQVQKGLVGGKAPPKKVKRPPSNPGEEVIVVKTTEVPPKEPENAKQSDEEDSAHDQILIPVEVDGDEAPNNNAEAYESDFEDEDDTPSGRSQQPDEDGDNKVQLGTPVDENDHPKALPVLYHKDWDSQRNQQQAVKEPIAEEQEEEEDKRQIRGLADDFADDDKGDEKNAFVSAEKSANPDAVEDFEDDTLRKVEGYSSEEEDLDGKKDKTIVVEKKIVSQNEDTVKPKTVQVKDTAASNRSPPPGTQIKSQGREEDSSSESSFSSSSPSSSSSSPSENSTPRDEKKIVSPTKNLEDISEADRAPSRFAEATKLSDRSDSYKSSTSSSSASDAESRPTSLPERPKSPVKETLIQEEKEEEREIGKIKEEKNRLSPSKEEEEPRNDKSLVSKQTALPSLMDSARSEPESTATRGGESESVRESSSSSEDSSSYSSSDSESDDLGPDKDRSPAQKRESQGDSKHVKDSSSSSGSASGSESERSARPITPFPTRKEKVSGKAESEEESDKSSRDKNTSKPAMSPVPVDAAEGPADSTSDMQQNADNAEVSEKRAVLSSAIVAAAAIMAPAVPPDMDSESLMAAAGRSEKKDSPDGDGKKPDSGSSSVDSSSDSSTSSSSSSEIESESEGELIVQEETPRGPGDSASREGSAPRAENDTAPAVVLTDDTSGGYGTKTEDSDSEEPQQTKLPAPHATPQPEQTTFPSPPRSPSKSHPAEQTEQVPPPVPTVVVIPTTPDIREGQGSGEWQDRAATPVQGPRQTGGLPAQFAYQPKHSAESDDKTGEDGQTRRTSESEAENMHGGNDPDRVADNDAAKWQSILEFVQPPPQTMHPGSLTPLLEDQNAIDINNINLTKAQVVEIMQTIEIKDNLQAVTISNCSLSVEDMNKLLQSLAKSPSNPRILNLNYNILGPRSVVPLVEILKIKPSIDMLLLQGNPIGNEGLQTLVDGLLDIEFEAHEYKKRESERMGGVPVMSIKGRFCQLQELDLSETSITDDGMVDVVLLLESNLDLHTLSLSSCPDITNPGWSKLATALTKNKNLKTLTIQNNKIGDEGIRILVEGLKNNTSLSTLEVANAGIEEAGGRALIDLLKRNTTVQYLTLRPGNDIPQKTQDEINRYLSLNQTKPPS